MDVIDHLMEDSQALNQDFLDEMGQAEMEVKEGQLISNEDVKKKLGL